MWRLSVGRDSIPPNPLIMQNRLISYKATMLPMETMPSISQASRNAQSEWNGKVGAAPGDSVELERSMQLPLLSKDFACCKDKPKRPADGAKMVGRTPAGSPNRMLKHSFTPRLLKKVQMQGGARCETRGVLTRTSQRRASAPTRQMGLFQQPAKRIHPSRHQRGMFS